MVAKLSSRRIIALASFATSVPVTPMATPMSARFSAGASLTPSPVIATNCPAVLERRDDLELLLGGDPRVDSDVAHPLLERLQRQRGKLGPGHDGIAVAHDPEPPGDRPGRERMVSRDHDRHDAGGLARRDGRLRLLARGVDDADEAEEGELPLDRLRRERRGQGRPSPHADGQHPQAVGRHPLARRHEVVPVEDRRPGRGQDSADWPRTASTAPFVKEMSPPAGSRWRVVMHFRSESNGSSATRG